MKKIVNAQFDETWYTHTLDNGLNLIFWHKPDFVSTAVVFATPYGALDYRQIDKAGNHLDFPSGIAHFLEHKLFESDEGDVMKTFRGWERMSMRLRPIMRPVIILRPVMEI
ncbi:MAG: hypothetical protein ACLSA6_10780 [Holdemania massiliensis]